MNTFVIFLFGLAMGAAAVLQLAEEDKHRAAMHEAMRPVCMELPRVLARNQQ